MLVDGPPAPAGPGVPLGCVTVAPNVSLGDDATAAVKGAGVSHVPFIMDDGISAGANDGADIVEGSGKIVALLGDVTLRCALYQTLSQLYM